MRQHKRIYLNKNGIENFLKHKHEGCGFRCFRVSNPKQYFKNYACPDSLRKTLLAKVR